MAVFCALLHGLSWFLNLIEYTQVLLLYNPNIQYDPSFLFLQEIIF